MDLYDIYTKDEVPRQRDYSLSEYYPNGAVRSKCALRRLPDEDAMANGKIETTYSVLTEGSRPDFEKRKKQKREKDTEAENKILDDEKK